MQCIVLMTSQKSYQKLLRILLFQSNRQPIKIKFLCKKMETKKDQTRTEGAAKGPRSPIIVANGEEKSPEKRTNQDGL